MQGFKYIWNLKYWTKWSVKTTTTNQKKVVSRQDKGCCKRWIIYWLCFDFLFQNNYFNNFLLGLLENILSEIYQNEKNIFISY